MRRRNKSGGASLDSLLDTMTNVVGILVILLTVTQLGVGDAVKRIAATASVSPKALEEAEKTAEEVRADRLRVYEHLESLVKDNPRDVSKDLTRVKKQMEDHKADIAVLREHKGQKKLLAEQEAQKLLEEAKRLVEEHKKKVSGLTEKINQSEQELAKLRARLADTPEQGAPEAKVVNLPNPRAAPKGITPLTFLCREGRLLFVDINTLRGRALKRADYIVLRNRLGLDPKLGVDGKILCDRFNERKIRDRDIELSLTVSGRYPRLVFGRQKGAGEDVSLLKHASSRYSQQVRRIDPKKHYLRFLVWPDSFETYLEARKIASQRGLLAGWQAMSSPAEYMESLGGKIRVGPPPPPRPKPAPGTPKPKPKPKPPKPLPSDVID